MEYYVSRQCQWMTGNHVVEIAAGGLDYSGPDKLCDNYGALGEGLETNDPREAVKAAIAVRDAWNKDLKAAYTAGECGLSDPISCHIEAGYNLDMITPTEEPTDEQLHEWAQKEWDDTPKCANCNAAVELPYHIPELGEDTQFCSERCADQYWADEYGEKGDGT